MKPERKQHLQVVDIGIGRLVRDEPITFNPFKLQALAKRPQPPKEKNHDDR